MKGKIPESICNHHPLNELLWIDGSLCCFACRSIWHKDFPAHAAPPETPGYMHRYVNHEEVRE